MLRRGDPVGHCSLELFCRHARVRRHDHLDQSVLARCGDGLDVVFENAFEGLLFFPFWVLWCDGSDTVHREEGLEVHGLLGPEGAVVVEDGDAFSGWHEAGRAGLGASGDEEDPECGADVIVTFNLKDFPNGSLDPYGVEAQHPDDFIAHLLDLNQAAALRCVRDQRAALRNPSKTVDELLDTLREQGLPQTVSVLKKFAAEL